MARCWIICLRLSSGLSTINNRCQHRVNRPSRLSTHFSRGGKMEIEISSQQLRELAGVAKVKVEIASSPVASYLAWLLLRLWLTVTANTNTALCLLSVMREEGGMEGGREGGSNTAPSARFPASRRSPGSPGELWGLGGAVRDVITWPDLTWPAYLTPLLPLLPPLNHNDGALQLPGQLPH